jgi:hypothetical protein
MEVSGQLHTSAALPPGKDLSTHWIGGWVGPRTVLDTEVVKEEPFFPEKIRSFLPYRVSEIRPKDSGVILPTNSLPWRHQMLQNDRFCVEEDNEHDFTRGSFHLSRSFILLWSASTAWKPQLFSLHLLHRLDGWVIGFPINFFQAKHRIQSRNADAPLMKYLVAPPS